MANRQILSIKIRRDIAGKKVPYDKIYFFRRKDRNLIHTMFDYALVLPVTEELINTLKEVTPRVMSRKGFVRDDENNNKLTELDGRQDPPEKIAAWWDTNFFKKYAVINRLAVVPILTSQRKKKRLPRYLGSKRWYKTGTRKKNPYSEENQLIHELAYLATPLPAPHNKIQPICAICPRQLLRISGECSPGMDICYKSLDFNKILDTEKSK